MKVKTHMFTDECILLYTHLSW